MEAWLGWRHKLVLPIKGACLPKMEKGGCHLGAREREL